MDKAKSLPQSGQAQAILASIRLGRKGLTGANTTAYLANSYITKKKGMKHWHLG